MTNFADCSPHETPSCFPPFAQKIELPKMMPCSCEVQRGTSHAPRSGLARGKPVDLVSGLSADLLRRLIERIDTAPLFAHTYAHHLNLRFGSITPVDLLHSAHQHGLSGLKIHVEDGEERSLLSMNKSERRQFRQSAAQFGLKVHVETSSTARHDLDAAAAIARDIKAESVRCYSRYEGRVSEIIRKTIDDLRALRDIDPEGQFLFTLEQHEDLKSHELVEIITTVGNPRLTLLFDFGNMINAYQRPGDALATMTPLVTEVHIKDVRIVEDRGGWGHLACRSGEGDIDFHVLLRDLLLLGEDAPQVTAFGLEEEVGRYAPAYRFPDEPADPFTPARDPSTTDLPANETLEDRLARERNDAARQVHYVRSVLAGLRRLAAEQLNLLTTKRPSASTQRDGII